MSLLAWIVFGALVGCIAFVSTKKRHGINAVIDMIAGIAGALVGATLAGIIGVNGLGEFNIISFLVATVGAIILISIIRTFDNHPTYSAKE